jgi:hypothetical protein
MDDDRQIPIRDAARVLNLPHHRLLPAVGRGPSHPRGLHGLLRGSQRVPNFISSGTAPRVLDIACLIRFFAVHISARPHFPNRSHGRDSGVYLRRKRPN